MTTAIKETIAATKGEPITFVDLSKRTKIPYATLKNAAKRNKITIAGNDVLMDDKTAAYIKDYKPRKRGPKKPSHTTAKQNVKAAKPVRKPRQKSVSEDEVIKMFDELSEQVAATRRAYVEKVASIAKISRALDVIDEARNAL